MSESTRLLIFLPFFYTATLKAINQVIDLNGHFLIMPPAFSNFSPSFELLKRITKLHLKNWAGSALLPGNRAWG